MQNLDSELFQCKNLFNSQPSESLEFFHSSTILTFFFFYKLLLLAALGLRCYAWAFSSCGERGLLFIAVRGLLIAVASLVAEHGF